MYANVCGQVCRDVAYGNTTKEAPAKIWRSSQVPEGGWRHASMWRGEADRCTMPQNHSKRCDQTLLETAKAQEEDAHLFVATHSTYYILILQWRLKLIRSIGCKTVGALFRESLLLNRRVTYC